MRDQDQTVLKSLLQSGIEAVKGDVAVKTWVADAQAAPPSAILAVGKAAVSMFQGLPAAWRSTVTSLVVTKEGHVGGARFAGNVTILEAGHPMPTRASLAAGARAVEFVTSLGPQDRLMVLVSGGASAVLEHLIDGVSYEDLLNLTQKSLSEGADIAEINSRRKEISAIKGGKLLDPFRGAQIEVLAISDVRGESIEVIGSGIGHASADNGFDYNCTIVASNRVARAAVLTKAHKLGLTCVTNEEALYDDVEHVADHIAGQLVTGPAGLYVFGGEPTVVLPQDPGQGGRNQALALELSKRLQGRSDIVGLVAGTDGTDGPTDAAGAFFDGHCFGSAPGAQGALEQANSAPFLAQTGYQLVTGPTGTNVMDLVLALKSG